MLSNFSQAKQARQTPKIHAQERLILRKSTFAAKLNHVTMLRVMKQFVKSCLFKQGKRFYFVNLLEILYVMFLFTKLLIDELLSSSHCFGFSCFGRIISIKRIII